MSQEIHRELGNHDARLENLEKEVHAIRVDMARVFDKLDQINIVLSEARGGWRTLLMVGGLASALTAGLLKLVGFLGIK